MSPSRISEFLIWRVPSADKILGNVSFASSEVQRASACYYILPAFLASPPPPHAPTNPSGRVWLAFPGQLPMTRDLCQLFKGHVWSVSNSCALALCLWRWEYRLKYKCPGIRALTRTHTARCVARTPQKRQKKSYKNNICFCEATLSMLEKGVSHLMGEYVVLWAFGVCFSIHLTIISHRMMTPFQGEFGVTTTRLPVAAK